MTLKYVVTAPARSGTTYAATVLSEAGAQCGHESVFNSWGRDYASPPRWQNEQYWWGDSSYVAAPFMDRIKADGLKVVHLVRPPLDMIRSVVGIAHVGNIDNAWVRFLDHHCHITQLPPGPQRAAAYWVRWNEMIEAGSPDLTWKLHEISADEILELGMVADIDIDPFDALTAVAETPTDLNHRNRAEWVTIDHLGSMKDPVCAVAERLGVPLEIGDLGTPGSGTAGVPAQDPVGLEDDGGSFEDFLVLNHVGAGWYELVDSGGDVVDKVRGKADAEARRDELSRGTTDEDAEGGT